MLWSDVSLADGACLVRGTKSDKAHRRINLAPRILMKLTERAERVGTDGYVFAAPAHHTTIRSGISPTRTSH